jgi:multiple sugar transport system permease protein
MQVDTSQADFLKVRQVQAEKSPWQRLWGAAMRWVDNTRAFPAALLLPVLLFFIIWNVVPTLWMIGLSFYKYALISGKPPQFIGTANYNDILNDISMWQTFSRTFVWVLFGVGFQTVLGFLLGLLFWGSKEMPGRRLALTLLFSPMILTPLAAGVFYRLIYEPTFGVVNFFITALGGQKVNFLTDPGLAFGSVLVVDIWMWTPFMILITLAALGSVPQAELEAAQIDRLSWFKRFRYIILPHGRFILMLGILLRTIDSFKTMDLVFVMTRGGPGNITEFIGLSLYRKAFDGLNMGYASALAILLLLTAIAFTSIYLYILNLRLKEQEEA